MTAAVQTPEAAERPGPKVTELGMLSIGLVAAGVIYLAAYLPRRAPLVPAVVLLARQPGFAWGRFSQVARWMLLAYVVVAGMLEFTFVYDHTRGAVLAVMTLLLATFTLNVPLLAAYTVARYEDSRE
jgi:hypothetical protein